MRFLPLALMLASLGCGTNSSSEGPGGGGSGGTGGGPGGSTGGSGPGGASTGGSGGTGGTGGVGAGVPCEDVDSFATGVTLVGHDGDEDIEVVGMAGVIAAPAHTCDEGKAALALDAGGKPWAFCLSVNGRTLPVEVGDVISFDLEEVSDVDLGEFHTVFALRDAMDALLYFSASGTLRTAAEFDIEEGAYLCGGDPDPKCIERRTGLIVSANGESVELVPPEVRVVGGDLEFHVRGAEHVDDAGACDSNTGFLTYYFAIKAP